MSCASPLAAITTTSNPKIRFHSISASYTQVMENAPGDPPIILAYRLNGEPLPLLRGGPVRVIVPSAYGFKNVKWLQRLKLTSDTKPVNTYGGDPDSYLKTMAWSEGPTTFKAGAPITFSGAAVCGLAGLKRVEYWLRPDTGTDGKLSDDDPAWKTATWQPCVIEPPPNDWQAHLPAGISSKELWGFDPETGKPKEWPLRYSLAMWTATPEDLKAGAYELRVRSVDQSGFAQPEPRPQQRSGKNAIQCQDHQSDLELAWCLNLLRLPLGLPIDRLLRPLLRRGHVKVFAAALFSPFRLAVRWRSVVGLGASGLIISIGTVDILVAIAIRSAPATPSLFTVFHLSSQDGVPLLGRGGKVFVVAFLLFLAPFLH